MPAIYHPKHPQHHIGNTTHTLYDPDRPRKGRLPGHIARDVDGMCIGVYPSEADAQAALAAHDEQTNPSYYRTNP